MSTDRRKFLLQSGMAATAILLVKPFSVFGRYASPLSTSLKNTQITFLHTTGPGYAIAEQVSHINTSRKDLVLLHTGPTSTSDQGVKYDATLDSVENSLMNDYQVIDRGNMRIGIVTAKEGERHVAERIDRLSAFLKEEKKCQLVVCISQLGFRTKNGTDDISLAAKTTGLDIIIGSRKASSPQHPYIALNKKNAEVIIQHTGHNEAAVGKIQIAFNANGARQSVSF